MAGLKIDPARSAVLSMDMQAGIVSIYVRDKDMMPRATSVLKAARQSGMSVLHVRVGFRPGLPEVSPRNLLFNSIRTSPQHQQLFDGAAGAIHPAVAPEGKEPVIIKHRVNAFKGTDLEMMLRAKDVDTLVLFGIATGGVVLSTLLDAADADYRLIVIKDCCADLDPDLHACLVGKVFPKCGAVVAASEFAGAVTTQR